MGTKSYATLTGVRGLPDPERSCSVCGKDAQPHVAVQQWAKEQYPARHLHTLLGTRSREGNRMEGIERLVAVACATALRYPDPRPS